MARFEIYFFGLICFNTDDGVAEIVQDHHPCPFIYAPEIGKEIEITGDLSVSLPPGNPAPPSAVTNPETSEGMR